MALQPIRDLAPRLMPATLTTATHSITAAYAGDAGNAASTSAALSQVVNAGGSINVALASNGGDAARIHGRGGDDLLGLPASGDAPVFGFIE